MELFLSGSCGHMYRYSHRPVIGVDALWCTRLQSKLVCIMDARSRSFVAADLCACTFLIVLYQLAIGTCSVSFANGAIVYAL